MSGSDKIAYLTDIPNKDAAGNLDGSMLGTISIVSKIIKTNKLFW